MLFCDRFLNSYCETVLGDNAHIDFFRLDDRRRLFPLISDFASLRLSPDARETEKS